MLDPFLIWTPVLVLPLIGLLRFIGCTSFSAEVPPTPPPEVQHTVQVSPGDIEIAPGKSQTFGATVDGHNKANVTWTAGAPGTLAAAVYSYPDPYEIPRRTTDQVTAESKDFPGTKGTATVHLISNSAKFVASDAGTKGFWQGLYGKKGYAIASPKNLPTIPTDNLNQLPPYLNQLTGFPGVVTNNLGSPPDPSALANPTPGKSPIVAFWPTATELRLTLEFTDSVSHRVAIYCVDWQNLGRKQTIDILDPSQVPITTLDSQTLQNFHPGIYLIWDLTGKVQIRVTHTAGGGPTAVMSAIFFE